MAWAMKCDRCGKYYELCDDATSGVALLSYDIGKDKYCDEARFDICPDCVKSFDEWFMEVLNGGKR